MSLYGDFKISTPEKITEFLNNNVITQFQGLLIEYIEALVAEEKEQAVKKKQELQEDSNEEEDTLEDEDYDPIPNIEAEE